MGISQKPGWFQTSIADRELASFSWVPWYMLSSVFKIVATNIFDSCQTQQTKGALFL